jgi:hypothetical protein
MRLKGMLLATVVLGLIFLWFQGYEYLHAYRDLGLRLDSGIYGNTFFILTGFHGLHVLLGTLFLTIIWLRIMLRIISPHSVISLSRLRPGTGTSSMWSGSVCSSLSTCFDAVLSRTRVGLQPAHREREQQYDDHQQGEEDAGPEVPTSLRIACTEHQPEGVKQLADDEQQHEYQNDLDQHLGILLDMRDSAARDKRRPWHHRRWFVLLFTLVVTAGLCKLAFWQWQRGMEKRPGWRRWQRCSRPGQDIGPDRLATPGVTGWPASARKVEWISPYVWLLDNQIVNGEVGYDVLIPVRAEGGSSPLLVNRDGCPRHPTGRNCPIPPSPPQ